MEQFSKHIWTVDAPMRVAGMKMGTRSTVIALPSGRLLIISPVAFDDETAAALEKIGPVDTIVAPNLMHHLYFDAACRRWPQSRALYPPGLREKTDLIDRAVELGDRGSLEEAVHWIAVAGAPKFGEYLFVDERDGVLVITDIAFHYADHPQWWLRTFMRLNDAYGKFGISRIGRSLIDDDEAFGQSLSEILEYSWDSIIVAHGEPIEIGGRQIFEQAFAQYLK